MAESIDRGRILEMMWHFRETCVIGAAAELELFDHLADTPLSVAEVTARLKTDLRATQILLDAVTALGLLNKSGDYYQLSADLKPWLTSNAPSTVTVTSNGTLNEGSSKHGNARRQSVACICVVAMTRSAPTMPKANMS